MTFLPSEETFTKTEFDYGTLEHRLRELAFLNSGFRILLTDKRKSDIRQEEMLYDGALKLSSAILTGRKSLLSISPSPFAVRRTALQLRSLSGGTIAIMKMCFVFTNNIPQTRRRNAYGRLSWCIDASGPRPTRTHTVS